MPSHGTVSFWLGHRDPDWFSNRKAYRFPPKIISGLSIVAQKNSDCTITLVIRHLRPDRLVEFTEPIPPCGRRGLLVAFSWEPTQINLYLNGKIAAIEK